MQLSPALLYVKLTVHTESRPKGKNILCTNREIMPLCHVDKTIDYHMLNNSYFEIVNFPFLDGDVPRSPSYGVYISQLILATHSQGF